VRRGEIKALMGRNGMGKTTLLKTIMGLLPPSSGSIVFDGHPVHGLATHNIATRGIGYVPQGREIFDDFTVMENLRLGILRNPRKNRDVPPEIFDFFPILHERRNQRAGSFSGGEQQMLAIARALASHPTLLRRDEPSEGIQPSLVEQIGTILKTISDRTGLTILVVEQNVDMILEMAASCAFMEGGRIVQTCGVDELQADESIMACHMSV
jgi:branched-chain amino acid transport system ATP-binding protein/urea transport system ATP-binding protein